MPRLVSGLGIANVAALPTASAANVGWLLEQGGLLWFSTGSTWIQASLPSTAAGRTLLNAADVPAQRTALGLGTAATTAAGAYVANNSVGSNSIGMSWQGSGNIRVTVDVTNFTLWSSGNSAQVIAGTVTGQIARWNQTTGRYESFDLLGTANTWTGTQRFNFATATFGAQAFNQGRIEVIGAGSGTNAGSMVITYLDDAKTIIPVAIGNRSAIFGGAFDSRGLLYSNTAGVDIDVGELRLLRGTLFSATYAFFEQNGGVSMSGTGGSSGGLEVQATGTGGSASGAWMSFHRPGNYAVHFGLDTDNQLKVGGWSLGSSTFAMWHAGNFGRYVSVTSNNDISGNFDRAWNSSANAPAPFYEVIHFAGAGPAHALQLAYFGGDTQNYFIRHFNDQNGWGGGSATWRQLWHSGNSSAITSSSTQGARPVWAQANGRWEAATAALFTADWNTTTTSGIWMANGASNAPASTWLIGHVVAHNDLWVTQELYDFTNNSPGERAVWRRQSFDVGGVRTWGAWTRRSQLFAAEDFNPTTSAVLNSAITASGAFGGGVVLRDGSVWGGMWMQSDFGVRIGSGTSAGLFERLLIGNDFLQQNGNANQTGFIARQDLIRRLALYHDAAAGEIRIARYNGSGSYAGDPLKISTATGDATFTANLSDYRGNVRSTPVNVQNGNYTFTGDDLGRKVMKNGASAVNYTLPTGFGQGATIIVRNKNATGNITIVRSGTVLRRVGVATDANATIAPWGEALLHCEEGNDWVISGVGVS